MQNPLIFCSKIIICCLLPILCSCSHETLSFNDETDTPTTPQPSSLHVDPTSLYFGADGETLQMIITAENTEWRITSDAEWLTISEEEGSSTQTVDVTAQPNPGANQRKAILTITGSETDTTTVTAIQAAAQTVPASPITLQQASACYLGADAAATDPLDRICLELRGTTSGNTVQTDVTVIIELHVAAATFATFDLPGIYTANLSDTPSEETFDSHETSHIITTDNAQNDPTKRYTTGGYVSIGRMNEDYQIDLSLNLGDGSTFDAVYEGKIDFIDASDSSSDVSSTLTTDAEPNPTCVTGIFSTHDDPSTPARKLTLQFYGDLTVSPVDYMTWALNVEPTASDNGSIEGLYTVIEKPSAAITAEDLLPGTIVPGEKSADQTDGNLFTGSWYRQLTIESGIPRLTVVAPFVKGRAVITRHEENYTIEFSFTDDNTHSPHTISGKYTGIIDFQNSGE